MFELYNWHISSTSILTVTSQMSIIMKSSPTNSGSVKTVTLFHEIINRRSPSNNLRTSKWTNLYFLRSISALSFLAPHAFSLTLLTVTFINIIVNLLVSHSLIKNVPLVFSDRSNDSLICSIFINVCIFRV